MKVTLKKEILLDSLKRGAYAALSEEAQSDTSTLSLIIKSVKISASKDNIIFESATALISSKYILPVSDEISVKEDGIVMIPANELYEWVNRQGSCYIGLSSKDLEDPQTVNVVSGNADVASKSLIKKITKVNLVSKDESKTGAKWSLDGYDYSVMPEIFELDSDQKPLFKLSLEKLLECIKNVGFSTMPKDPDHLFDCLSFQHIDKKMYALSTDATRCSVCNISNTDIVDLKECISFEQMSKGMKNSYEYNLLVSYKFLSDVSKLLSKDHVIDFL
jgi:DNA polymerase III sliding clamp (beta) subunit (PCNA family)